MVDASYKPIADYGAIGNLRTVALVARDGAIDWWCAPHMDSPSVFASLLDATRGGRFAVRPRGGRAVTQQYVEHTNVLETVLGGDGGRVSVLDFMPLEGDINGQGERSSAPPMLCRVLTAPPGERVEAELEWSPRFDYARADTHIEPTPSGAVATGGGARLTLEGLPLNAEAWVEAAAGGPQLRARFEIGAGRRVALHCAFGEAGRLHDGTRTLRSLEDTIDTWRGWLHKEEVVERHWADPWKHLAIRSELLLKLLIHADSGGLVAAPTTSLPEALGGERNWDYRFAWLRDSALVARSLSAVGHAEEMKSFLRWAERVSRPQIERGVEPQVVYGLHGSTEVPEATLDHLEGYAGSRPVRIGNAAFLQPQHDVFNNLSSSAYELLRRDEMSPDVWRMLRVLADQASSRWKVRDYGIWEMRTGPHHFVFSKVKVWEALTRALIFAREGVLDGDTDRWRRACRDIRREVLSRGYDEELGAFVMAYDKRALDAVNVQLGLAEIVEPDDPRLQSTIDRTMEQLTERGLVYRYRTEDGFDRPEGAFVICTFWLADALALSGRVDEARAIFDGLAGRANHLGLFAEQIEPSTGRFLGNFPQALSHLGLINSLLYLAYAEGRPLPIQSLIGTPEHRRKADIRC